MNALDGLIQSACASTEPTKARRTALAGIKWRLRYGLLYAGLDPFEIVHPYRLVSADDPRCVIFDGRDNEELKTKWYGIHLGCKFEVELCAS